MSNLRSPSQRRVVFVVAALTTVTALLAACKGADSATAPPVVTPPVDTAVTVKVTPQSVSAGGSHSCVVADAGATYCWGRNVYGALGTGVGAGESARPRAVVGSLAFASVSAGYVHTCGLTTAGSAYCWGWYYERANVKGAIGDGTEIDRAVPTAVAGGLVFREIAAGGHHSCGVTTANVSYCWGRNVNGDLGTGDTSGVAQLRPVIVVGNHVFHGFALGYRSSCGLEPDGTAYCWGASDYGQLGNGTNAGSTFSPAAVSGGLRFLGIAAAQFGAHVCGIAADSTAYCWGGNDFGQVGDGSTVGRKVPTRVSGGQKFVSIGAGGYYSCGLTVSGQAYCWGSVYAADRVGQPSGPTPRLMVTPNGVTFSTLTVGANHACAMTATKVIYCWGAGGAVGDGTQLDRDQPTAVVGFKTSPP